MPFPACFVRPYFAIIPNVLQYSDCTPVLRLYSGTPNGLQYSKANSELCLGDRNFVRVISIRLECLLILSAFKMHSELAVTPLISQLIVS